jgi:hypothetical protein
MHPLIKSPFMQAFVKQFMPKEGADLWALAMKNGGQLPAPKQAVQSQAPQRSLRNELKSLQPVTPVARPQPLTPMPQQANVNAFIGSILAPPAVQQKPRRPLTGSGGTRKRKVVDDENDDNIFSF